VLALVPGDVGYSTAMLLAEWGAYRAMRAGADFPRLFGGALRGVLGAAIVQPLLGFVSMGLLLLGFSALARSCFHHGVTLVLAVLVLASHAGQGCSDGPATDPATGRKR
jgi:hypothetical protein